MIEIKDHKLNVENFALNGRIYNFYKCRFSFNITKAMTLFLFPSMRSKHLISENKENSDKQP